MLTSEKVIEIIRAISALPPDKVDEVRDFAYFLKARYAIQAPVEYSDVWTDEDLHDLTAAALQHASHTIWMEDERNG